MVVTGRQKPVLGVTVVSTAEVLSTEDDVTAPGSVLVLRPGFDISVRANVEVPTGVLEEGERFRTLTFAWREASTGLDVGDPAILRSTPNSSVLVSSVVHV